MTRFLALFLVLLVLLQSFGSELLVASYTLNKTAITARYCVNKARPQLRCQGRCHLARQLRRAAGADPQAPAQGKATLKFEALPTAALRLPVAPRRWPLPARRYARPTAAPLAEGPLAGVFRPPVWLA